MDEFEAGDDDYVSLPAIGWLRDWADHRRPQTDNPQQFFPRSGVRFENAGQAALRHSRVP